MPLRNLAVTSEDKVLFDMEINKSVEDDGVIFMSIKGNSDDSNAEANEGDVTILAIESSCDETAAAVVRNGREVLSNIISSQISLHTMNISRILRTHQLDMFLRVGI